MNKYICLILLSFCLKIQSNPLIKVGDFFAPYFWTEASDTSKPVGYSGLIRVSDQINDTNFLADFKIYDTQWWQGVVPDIHKKIKIIFSNQKPDSVTRCSEKFKSALWLRSFKDSTGSKADSSLRFYFPILPRNQSYNLYDFFSIKLSDTMNLQFQGVQDSLLVGSFSRQVSGEPTFLYAKNAIAIQTTAANSLRIKKVQILGKYEKYVSLYMHFRLSILVDNATYYGTESIDTTVTTIVVKPSRLLLKE
jgi:hypothetical protein